MKNIIGKITESIHYSLASIKNRYPCKIVSIKQPENGSLKNKITYQAVNKVNIRNSMAEDIISDPMLVEKFHPTDCVKLGFVSAGEILFKDSLSVEEMKDLHKKIVIEMFQGNK